MYSLFRSGKATLLCTDSSSARRWFVGSVVRCGVATDIGDKREN